MVDKKLITYDCVLTFSFQTKDSDFLNSNFTFNHICLVMDSLNGGIFNLSSTLFGCPHLFITCDLKNALFQCSPVEFVDLSSEYLLKSVMAYQNSEPVSDCVFCYQPVKGSRFFLGVKERSLNEKKEIKSACKSKKFPRRRRYKKTELGIQSNERWN